MSGWIGSAWMGGYIHGCAFTDGWMDGWMEDGSMDGGDDYEFTATKCLHGHEIRLI